MMDATELNQGLLGGYLIIEHGGCSEVVNQESGSIITPTVEKGQLVKRLGLSGL